MHRSRMHARDSGWSLWSIMPLGSDELPLADSADADEEIALENLLPASMQRVAGKSGEVAIIPIQGTLSRGPMLGRWSDARYVRDMVAASARDSAVTAIMLLIDSPGGTVAGVEELANEIRRARLRKPVIAQIEDVGASAAYWIASQAHEVVASSRTTLVGGVGTILVMYDTSEAYAREGVKPVVVASGELKSVGADGVALTDQQRAYLQELVDDTQAVFSEAVLSSRKLGERAWEQVRSGRVWTAERARDLKLIDEIIPASKTLERLRMGARSVLPEAQRRALLTLRPSA